MRFFLEGKKKIWDFWPWFLGDFGGFWRFWRFFGKIPPCRGCHRSQKNQKWRRSPRILKTNTKLPNNKMVGHSVRFSMYCCANLVMDFPSAVGNTWLRRWARNAEVWMMHWQMELMKQVFFRLHIPGKEPCRCASRSWGTRWRVLVHCKPCNATLPEHAAAKVFAWQTSKGSLPVAAAWSCWSFDASRRPFLFLSVSVASCEEVGTSLAWSFRRSSSVLWAVV